MKKNWNNIKHTWNRFWFEYQDTMPWEEYPFGSNIPLQQKKIHWQRIKNIILILIILFFLFKML